MGWQMGWQKLSVYLAEGACNASHEAGGPQHRIKPRCDEE